MRTKWQAAQPALRWPLMMVVIALAALAVVISWPTRAPANPTEDGSVAAVQPSEDRSPASASGASDYFLNIDGVEGESTDDKHKGEIDLLSWSWGASSSTPLVGAGKAEFTDVTFTMATSKASPVLMLACAQGKHFKTAVLTVRGSGEGKEEYLKVTFSDVVVTSFQVSGSSSDARPVEEVSLVFGQIRMEYRQQNPDGSMGDWIRTAWDVKRNRPL